MSLSSHLDELRRKHAVLHQTIEAESKSRGADELRIREMKREKLRLKDEIRCLSKKETIH